MIFLIGAFFIVLSILLDDGSTILLFAQGLGALEQNPIYTHYGLFAFIALSIIFYSFFLLCWYAIIHLYKQFYDQHAVGYKLYDIFLFFFCFMVIFFATTKIDVALSNIDLLVDSFDDDKLLKLQSNAQYAEDYKLNHPAEFKKIVNADYFETVMKLSYLQAIFNAMAAYLLFRVGYKVCPYEHG